MDAYTLQLQATMLLRMHDTEWFCELCDRPGMAGTTLRIETRELVGEGTAKRNVFFRCSDLVGCAERVAA
jgi:hypothetical protein